MIRSLKAKLMLERVDYIAKSLHLVMLDKQALHREAR
jgi:hypothetical protein